MLLVVYWNTMVYACVLVVVGSNTLFILLLASRSDTGLAIIVINIIGLIVPDRLCSDEMIILVSFKSFLFASY